MADEAVIGYPPARVWGCPTTAMWVYRLGAEEVGFKQAVAERDSGARIADGVSRPLSPYRGTSDEPGAD